MRGAGAPDRRWLQNALVLGLGVVAILGLLEAALRLGGHRVSLYDKAIYVRSPYPDMVYQLRPNYRSSNWGGGPLALNALGFRDRLVSATKAPGVVRIVGIGDSFTFGNGVVGPEETYLRVLEAAIDTPRVETVNFGVPGYNTAQEVALFRHVGLAYQPDLVLLGYVLNDHMGVPEDIAASIQSPPSSPSPLKALARQSHVVYLLVRGLGPWLPWVYRGVEGYGEAFYREFDRQPGWGATRSALAELAALGRAHGTPVLVVVFPFVHRLHAYPYEAYHREVCRISREAGAACLDLLDVLRSHRDEGLYLSHADPHPTARAHALAGAAIAGFLREHRLLAPRS